MKTFTSIIVVLSVLIAAGGATPVSLAAKVENSKHSKNQNMEKRGLLRNLACCGKGANPECSQTSYQRNSSKNTENLRPLSVFEVAYSEVKADALCAGDDAAYDSMRQQLMMILGNLRAVVADLGDPDDLECVLPEEREKLILSAKTAFERCKSHFEAFQSRDWEWFFALAAAKDSALKEHHRRVFSSHFEVVRQSIERCAERYLGGL